MYATLGGLIKDFRLQKNISQLEIAFALGWKEPSRLSRIEQGRVGRPKRELINRIMNAMKLSYQERNNLLYAGGYLPEDSELADIRKTLKKTLTDWPYPLVAYDAAWRIVDFNKSAAAVYKFDKTVSRDPRKEQTNLIEFLFHPANPQNKHLKDAEEKNRHGLLKSVLIQFQHATRTTTQEKWYKTLIQRMMGNKLFNKLWKEVQGASLPQNMVHRSDDVAVDPSDPKKRLIFTSFTMPLMDNPRFFLIYSTPADEATMRYF